MSSRNKDCVLDEDGQPDPVFRQQQNADRSIDELVGVARGLIADGVLSKKELNFLLEWMQANAHCEHVWPASALFESVYRISDAEEYGEDQRQELFDVLRKMVGGSTAPGHRTTILPLDNPVPTIRFRGSVFVVTGKMVSGPRKSLENEITLRYGIVKTSVTMQTDYLIVGEISSRDWLHTTHGLKILKAIENQKNHDANHDYVRCARTAIIGERDFVTQLKQAPV